jgi:hypothetical protein
VENSSNIPVMRKKSNKLLDYFECTKLFLIKERTCLIGLMTRQTLAKSINDVRNRLRLALKGSQN